MIDIDHPAIQVGVGALFGQHPERGGQERAQAVFAVLNAVIEAGYLVESPAVETRISDSGPIIVGADRELEKIRMTLIGVQKRNLSVEGALAACDYLIKMSKRTPEIITPTKKAAT